MISLDSEDRGDSSVAVLTRELRRQRSKWSNDCRSASSRRCRIGGEDFHVSNDDSLDIEWSMRLIPQNKGSAGNAETMSAME